MWASTSTWWEIIIDDKIEALKIFVINFLKKNVATLVKKKTYFCIWWTNGGIGNNALHGMYISLDVALQFESSTINYPIDYYKGWVQTEYGYFYIQFEISKPISIKNLKIMFIDYPCMRSKSIKPIFDWYSIWSSKIL